MPQEDVTRRAKLRRVPPAKQRHDPARRPGPLTRKLLGLARRSGTGAETVEVPRPGLDPVPPSPRLAVRAVLLRTAVELARAVRKGTSGLGYELYHRAEPCLAFPSDWEEPLPESFAERLVRMSRGGERVLKDLIGREVAKLLGGAVPRRVIRREVNRRFGLFEALVFEGLSLRLW